MVDIASISAGLSSVKVAIDLTRELSNLSKSLENAEFRLKIAELAGALADTKMELVNAQDEILKLNEKVKELSEIKNYRSKLQIENGLYFFKEEVEGKEKGPYCTKCLDVDNKLVLVTALSRNFRTIGRYKCPNCGNPYQ